MIMDMGTLRITEAELARDVRAVLAKVEHGSEVIIEQEDHRPVAVIRSPRRSGRPITEILREARQRNSAVTLDEDFGKDLEEIIAHHQQPQADGPPAVR
jgi:low affinity Fe/Cu permease